jgi:hypothetical protein
MFVRRLNQRLTHTASSTSNCNSCHIFSQPEK